MLYKTQRFFTDSLHTMKPIEGVTSGTTLPKVVARANPALVEGLNNEDRAFAVSEKSEIFKGDCLLRRSLYGGVNTHDNSDARPLPDCGRRIGGDLSYSLGSF
ncbi:hypothetical protein AAC387_Pa12g1682 [Persea americana]